MGRYSTPKENKCRTYSKDTIVVSKPGLEHYTSRLTWTSLLDLNFDTILHVLKYLMHYYIRSMMHREENPK